MKRLVFRWLLALHAGLLAFAGALRGKPASKDKRAPRSILLTGTFFSQNWIMNHLRPLAMSAAAGEITLVCLFPIPETPKVRWICPPKWMCKILGSTPARLLVFMWVALCKRPDILGGFHIIPNGLLVALLAKFLGRRSLYFCGGGPREVLGGGMMGNRLLERDVNPDVIAENRLIAAMNSIDCIVCMGNRSVQFYQGRGVKSRFEVIPGGIDSTRFAVQSPAKEFDLIFVGRLVGVKRIDLFLDAVEILARSTPHLKAVIVGSGELEQELKIQAARLGITSNVSFAGQQSNVVDWLARSKTFVLTSDSEGLSLAMMEALTCGLPCVVSDVGELGEVIENDVNGYLVSERTGAAFARALAPMITDQSVLERLSTAARASADAFELSETAKKWDKILLEL